MLPAFVSNLLKQLEPVYALSQDAMQTLTRLHGMACHPLYRPRNAKEACRKETCYGWILREAWRRRSPLDLVIRISACFFNCQPIHHSRLDTLKLLYQLSLGVVFDLSVRSFDCRTPSQLHVAEILLRGPQSLIASWTPQFLVAGQAG